MHQTPTVSTDERNDAAQATALPIPPSEVLCPLPLIQPDFGGVVVARLSDNALHVSYRGPVPFGNDLNELFAAVGQHLAGARRLRIVESVSLVAVFDDETDAEDLEAAW